ncbi:MAG: D-glycero-alpha-D-manno-heptose-1,7-bisphosphate 7-phosphatase [Solirubrobacteraceae bacterium]
MVRGRLDAVLLDRDGTINVKAPEGEYITGPGQVELLPGAAEAISALNRADVPVVVVTNQRGIALGRMTQSDLAAVHRRLRELLESGGARLGRIFHCPHDKGVCECRKPGTLLLEQARDHLGLESLSHCVVIGDSVSDVIAGSAAGARSVLLSTGDCARPDGVEVARSLLDAVRLELVSKCNTTTSVGGQTGRAWRVRERVRP